jgi:hypothetical protein
VKTWASKKLIIAVGAAALMPLVSFGQGSISAAPTVAPAKPEKIFGAELSIENSQNLFSDKDYQKVNEVDFTLIPSLKIGSSFKVKLVSIIKQNQNGAKETELSNTEVSIGLDERTTSLGPFKWSPALIGALPTDAIENKQTKLKGAIGIKSTLHAVELTKSFPLEISWAVSILKSIHEYNMDADGEPLIEWSGKNRFALSYPISDRISLALLSDYVVGRTYGGFIHEVFANAIDLNFDVIKDVFTLNIGSSTEGNAFKYDGTTSSYSFFNDNVSVLRIGATYVY